MRGRSLRPLILLDNSFEDEGSNRHLHKMTTPVARRPDNSALGQRIDTMNQRLNRLFLTLTAGLVAIVGTVVVQPII